MVKKSYKLTNNIWHKSARMGEILNPCHNFEISNTLVYPVKKSYKLTNNIWHKSARMGEILNPCHNFEISNTLVYPE